MQTIDPDHELLIPSQPVDLNALNPERANQVSFLDLLIVIGRRKVFLATTTFTVMVLSVIACLVIPNRFTATTTILPPQQNSSLAGTLMSQMGSGLSMNVAAGLGLGGALNLKNPNDMAISFLKSRSVEEAMANRFDLAKRYKTKRMSDTLKAFEDHCNIETNVKDGLVRVSVSDHDPEQAEKMANAYIEEYKKFAAGLAVTEASQRRLFFDQQLEAAKNDLAKAEESMKNAEQAGGMIQLDSQAKALIEAGASLKAQIAVKEVQIRRMSLFATNNNPDLVAAREELAELQRDLKQLGGSQADIDSGFIVPRGRLPEAGLDYIRKLREVKYRELIFELLAKQLEAARLDEAREGSLIQVVDAAALPDRKSFPRLSIIGPIATLAWLMLALIWVFFQHGIVNARTRPEDREKLRMLKTLWRNPFAESGKGLE
jgi:uncharacterized protein involved in exopolysaccharide biosynthesis